MSIRNLHKSLASILCILMMNNYSFFLYNYTLYHFSELKRELPHALAL